MDWREKLPKHASYYLSIEQLECLFGGDLSNPPQELIVMLRQLMKDASESLHALHSRWDVIPDADRQKKIHGIRGTIINFGFIKVCEILEEVEKNPSHLSGDEIKATFFEALPAFDVTADLLKTMFPQL